MARTTDETMAFKGKQLRCYRVGHIGDRVFYSPLGITLSVWMKEVIPGRKRAQYHYCPQGIRAVFDWLKLTRKEAA